MYSLWVPKKPRVYPLEIYASILDKWSPSLAQFPITKNISVISNVDLYLSAKSTHNLETLKGKTQPSTSLRSTTDRCLFSKKTHGVATVYVKRHNCSSTLPQHMLPKSMLLTTVKY